MDHALLINIGIIAVILVGLVVTSNPLFVLALFFIQDMPYDLLQNQPGQDDGEGEEGEPCIGFTAQV